MSAEKLSLEILWQTFRDSQYRGNLPMGLTAEALREAFFFGAFSALTVWDKLLDVDKEKAAKLLELVMAEAKKETDQYKASR